MTDNVNDMTAEIAKTGFNNGVVPPHVQRMLDEQTQLSDRYMKLGAFFSTDFFASLPAEDQQLMHDQYGHMAAYLSVLNTRVMRAQA